MEINKRVSITYRYKNNFIYDSNPLIKFFFFLSNFFIIFLISNPIYLFIIFLNMILIAFLGKDLRKVFRFIKLTLYLGFAIFIINIILRNDGETVLVTFPFKIPIYDTINITLEVIIFSFIMVLQLILVIFIFSLINVFINPDELMKVFMKLRIPYTISLILILSTRFFPLLLEDMENIKDVARSRGVELDKGNWFIRIKNKIKLILPLLTNSLERSIQVAEALESRGFTISKKRKFYKKIKITKIDYFTLAINLISITILLFFIITQGAGNYNPFPLYHSPRFNYFDFFMILILFSSNISLIILLFLDRRIS